jgi:hypothetical protein
MAEIYMIGWCVARRTQRQVVTSDSQTHRLQYGPVVSPYSRFAPQRQAWPGSETTSCKWCTLYASGAHYITITTSWVRVRLRIGELSCKCVRA